MAIWRRSQSPQVVEIKSPQSGTIRCGNLCMIGTQNKRHHVSRERHFRTEQNRTEQNRTEQAHVITFFWQFQESKFQFLVKEVSARHLNSQGTCELYLTSLFVTCLLILVVYIITLCCSSNLWRYKKADLVYRPVDKVFIPLQIQQPSASFVSDPISDRKLSRVTLEESFNTLSAYYT
jgi:hypothetical protein